MNVLILTFSIFLDVIVLLCVSSVQVSNKHKSCLLCVWDIYAHFLTTSSQET